jgi:hypothetical protein
VIENHLVQAAGGPFQQTKNTENNVLEGEYTKED